MSDKNFMSYEDASEVLTEYAGAIKENRFTNKTYEEWLAMTEEERETGKYLVSGVPNADGNVAIQGFVKLWENPNPTAAEGFEGQTIVLSDDYTNYDLIFANALHTYNSTYIYSTIMKSMVGYRDQICLADTNTNKGLCNVRRPIYLSTNTKQVTWGTGTYQYANDTTQTSDNGYMVPYTIYGIKLNHTLTIDAIARDVSTSASKCMLDDETTSVQDVIKGIEDNINENGCVNICPTFTSKTNNDVQYVVADDGTVTANGTPSQNSSINVPIYLKAGRYKLSGSPSGGTNSTYRTSVSTTSWTAVAFDYGEGVEFDITAEDNYYVNLDVRSGYTASNLVFKPMITLASQSNSDYNHYVPYTMTNKQITDIISSLATPKFFDVPVDSSVLTSGNITGVQIGKLVLLTLTSIKAKADASSLIISVGSANNLPNPANVGNSNWHNAIRAGGAIASTVDGADCLLYIHRGTKNIYLEQPRAACTYWGELFYIAE